MNLGFANKICQFCKLWAFCVIYENNAICEICCRTIERKFLSDFHKEFKRIKKRLVDK